MSNQAGGIVPFTSFTALGRSERQALFCIPISPDEDHPYQWIPFDKLRLMKDDSNASFNAARAIEGWGHRVQNDMCAVHASIRWFPNHKGDFKCATSKSIAAKKKQKRQRGTQANKTKPRVEQPCSLAKMYNDLGLLRTFPLIGLVDHCRALMIEKWATPKKHGGYGEPTVAQKWEASWGQARTTRIERNFDHVLRGGLPSDNNTSERFNRGDKKRLAEIAGNARATSLEAFIPAVIQRVQSVSQRDLQFNKQLKGVVRSTVFHKRVDAIWRRYVHNNRNATQKRSGDDSYTYKPCCLELQFQVSHAPSKIPVGSILMVSETGIQELTLYFGEPEIDIRLESASEWRAALQHPTDGARRGETWLRTFKALVQRPEVIAKHFDDFHHLNAQVRMFVVCCPIDPSSSDQAMRALTILHDLLTREGIPMESLEELSARRHKGLVTCNCGVYLHYCWCKHSYAIAIERGIIRSPFFPRKRNPRNKNVLKTNKKNSSSALRPMIGKVGRTMCLTRDEEEEFSDDAAALTDDDKCLSDGEHSEIEDELDYTTDNSADNNHMED